jgi:adenylate kinase
MTVTRILVFGVSGVGKTTACARVAEIDNNFVHVRASKLLSEVTGRPPEQLRLAPEDAIRENQVLLAEAFDRFAASFEHATLLLDGHAVIDNNRALIPVPTEAVAALKPNGMILIEASPSVILERRRSDTRTRPIRTITEIKREIISEHNVVIGYKQTLALPLSIANADLNLNLKDRLLSLLRGMRAN